MITTLTIFVSLIVGAVLGRVTADTTPAARPAEPDKSRLDYLALTKQTTLYHPVHDAWAIVDIDGKPLRAARTLRAAIDTARGQQNG